MSSRRSSSSAALRMDATSVRMIFGVTDWGGDGKTRKDRAAALGIDIDIVPRIEDKADAIEEGRSFLNSCWIDTQHCARGIQCLDNYRKEWDEVRAVWRSKPLHDWASHGADSLMTGAMGFSPERERRPEMDRHRRRWSPPRSAWAVWSSWLFPVSPR